MSVLIFLVVVSIIGGIIAMIMGKVKESRSHKRFEIMSLDELQSVTAIPPWQPSVSLTSKTIYGNDAVAWFEALFKRTFEEQVDFEKNYSFLTREYVRFILGLKEFMEKCWPTLWGDSNFDPSKPVTLTASKADAYIMLVFQQTLEWLDKMAAEQENLMKPLARSESFPLWNRQIFKKETFVENVRNPSGLWSDMQTFVKIPSNPVVLQEEISRLSAELTEKYPPHPINAQEEKISHYSAALTKKCPQCAEQIKAEAKVCRYCGKKFDEEEIAQAIEKARLAQAVAIEEMHKRSKVIRGKTELSELQSSRRKRQIWGWILISIGAFFLLGLLATLSSGKEGSEELGPTITGLIIFVGLPLGFGIRQLLRAQRIKNEIIKKSEPISGSRHEQSNMNWKLIFYLSAFGLVTGVASVFRLPIGVSVAVPFIVWIAIAVLIVKKAQDRYFKHGFIVGVFNGVINALVQFIIFPIYVKNHPEIMQSHAETLSSSQVRFTELFTGVLGGLFIGLICGFFAWLVGKIISKRAIKDVSPSIPSPQL
jgi:hypothetical protein